MATYTWAQNAFWGAPDAPKSSAVPEESATPSVFVSFDLETTGLEPKSDRIVEIGAVKFDKLGPIGRFSVLINPGIPMPPEAGKVNGITDAMLADKPSLKQVFPDFLLFIKDTVLVAHNAPFDCSFINETLSRQTQIMKRAEPELAGQGSLLGGALADNQADAMISEADLWTVPFASLPNKVVDTRIFAKECFPNFPKYSLGELAKNLGITVREAHRADDDARVCMELFVKCAEKRS